MPHPSHLSFPPFHLDLLNEQLWRETALIPLRPKPFAVLRYLVAQAGRLVPSTELRTAVWPDVTVSEGVLRVYIRAVRAALGDEAATPQFIETVSRRGYRFIGKVVSSQHPVVSSQTQLSTRSLESSVQSPLSAYTPYTLLSTPTLLGRETELAQLHSWLEKALHGERQIIFVTGEPGIGKTTLVDAFLASLSTTHEVWSGRGQCIEQYGACEAYLPVLEALGRLCREVKGGRVIEILSRYAPTWLVQLPVLLSPAEREALQRQIQGATRERMLRELAEALEALTVARPVVVVLEDLHWSDVSTVELLAVVARRREAARLLVLGTYRAAELIVTNHPLKILKQELVAHGQCAEVALGYLSPAAVHTYVDQRLAPQGANAAVAAFAYQRTEGHPLFMVQITDYLEQQRALAAPAQAVATTTDGMAVEQAVPQGLRELIEAQLGRLSNKAQQVLEGASVVGIEFAVASIAAGLHMPPDAVEAVCEGLAQHGQFIEDRGLTEWPDGTVSGRYGFRHALYQEVLYERLGSGRRVRLHRLIGVREEAGYGKRATEIAAELAVRFEQGREYAKAIQYRQHAAEVALKRSAHREAIVHLHKGLELLGSLPDTPERAQRELLLQTTLGAALIATEGFGAVEVEHTYRRAWELCQHVQDTSTLFPILCGLWNFSVTRSYLQQASALAEQLFALAQRQPEPTLLLPAHNIVGEMQWLRGDLTATTAHIEAGLALYDARQHRDLIQLYGEDPGVVCHMYAALIRWLLGHPDRARHHITEGLRLAEELVFPSGRTQALWRGSVVYQSCGQVNRVHDYTQALIQLCQKEGLSMWLPGGTILHGWALTKQGQQEAGITQIQRGLDDWRAAGAELIRPYNLALLAEVYGEAHQFTEGLHAVTEALETVQKTGERWYEAELYRLKGELTLQKYQVSSVECQVLKKQKAQGKKHKAKIPNTQHPTPSTQAEAEACFHKAIDTARHQEAKSLELRAVMSLSHLWQQQGKRAEARQRLAEIYQWFTEGFDTTDLQEAKALLEAL